MPEQTIETPKNTIVGGNFTPRSLLIASLVQVLTGVYLIMVLVTKTNIGSDPLLLPTIIFMLIMMVSGIKGLATSLRRFLNISDPSN